MAVSRTSVESPPTAEQRPQKEGLSLQTLLIAALASATAALIVSQFWESGTIAASAMTPVLVAIASELFKKPVESDRLRSGVRSVSSMSRPSSGRTPKVMAPPPAGVEDGLRQRDNGVEAGPVKVYSSGSNKRPRALEGPRPRRKLHLKIALITGLVAFLIAAAALTLPELIFGGSVTGGDRGTTYFGGSSKSSDKSDSTEGGSSDGQSDSQDQSDPSGSGSDSGSGDSGAGSDQPTPNDSSSDEPAPDQPDSSTPAPDAPAPSQPAPQAPSGGTPSP